MTYSGILIFLIISAMLNCHTWLPHGNSVYSSVMGKEKEKENVMQDLLFQQRDHHLKTSSYANSRLDIVVVSLSSAGILLCIDLFSKIHKKEILANMYLIKLSLIMFSFSILFNLVSQYFSRKAHNMDEEYCENEIKRNSGFDNVKNVPEPICENKYVNYSEKASLFLFSFGILSAVIGIVI